MKRYAIGILIGIVAPVFLGVAVLAQRDEATVDRVEVDARTQQLRDRAAGRADEIRAQVSGRQITLKQDACRSQQSQLQSAITRVGANVATVKTNFDTAYSRLQAYYATGQSVVTNYDELKARVDATQEKAAIAADAVTSFEFELNCTEPDAAQKLAGFGQAVSEARGTLRDYKLALLELVKALRAGVQEQEAITEEES